MSSHSPVALATVNERSGDPVVDGVGWASLVLDGTADVVVGVLVVVAGAVFDAASSAPVASGGTTADVVDGMTVPTRTMPARSSTGSGSGWLHPDSKTSRAGIARTSRSCATADSGDLGGPVRHPAGGRWGEQRWPEDRERGRHSPAVQQGHQHGCEGAGVVEGPVGVVQRYS